MKATIFSVAIVGLAFTSCRTTTMKVEAGPVEGANYASYKSYKWVPLDKEEMSSLTSEDRDLRRAFVQEADGVLAKQGFTRVDEGASDLIIYARGIRMPGYRTIGQTPSYDGAYRPSDAGAVWLSDSMAGHSGYLSDETVRSIRLLISEPKSDRIVWRGKAFVGMDNERAKIMKTEHARSLARKLLKGFPPGS